MQGRYLFLINYGQSGNRHLHERRKWGFCASSDRMVSPIIVVDTGEALGLLKAMEWVKDLQLLNMDFEVDFKMVVDNIYEKQFGVSEFSVIISKCVHLLDTYLTNSDVKFIRRQANGVAHSLAKAALPETSFRIYSNIPS